MQINNVQDLDNAIALLENKKIAQEKTLRLQFKETVNSLTPQNLIKAAYKNAVSSNVIGSTLLKTATTVGSTILGGKLLGGNSLLSKLAGTVINSGTADNLLNNSNTSKVLAWGKAIVKNLFVKK
jgi:hypothetical protein